MVPRRIHGMYTNSMPPWPLSVPAGNTLKDFPSPSPHHSKKGLGEWHLWLSWQQCPHVPVMSNGTPKSLQHQDKGRLGKEMLFSPGWRWCLGAISSRFPEATMKAPTQCGTSKVFAVSQWKEDGMWHCAGPFTCPAVTAGQEYQCVVIENRWGWEHCPVYCQLQGVSSGEGCFLFGFFQIRKLHKVQLRQSYPDCRDCLFPVLAGSWMIHE